MEALRWIEQEGTTFMLQARRELYIVKLVSEERC